MEQELTFKCYHCKEDSGFTIPQDESVKRLIGEKGRGTVKFFCEHCKELNLIEVSEEKVKEILNNYFSKGGDMNSLIGKFKKLW